MKRIQHFTAWIKASGRKRETKFSLLYYVNRDIDQVKERTECTGYWILDAGGELKAQRSKGKKY
jgi:hypothetical protein